MLGNIVNISTKVSQMSKITTLVSEQNLKSTIDNALVFILRCNLDTSTAVSELLLRRCIAGRLHHNCIAV